MKTMSFLIILVLSACSSTGVMPYEIGTYIVITSDITGSEAKRSAYQQARNYCNSQSKSFIALQAPIDPNLDYALIFNCWDFSTLTLDSNK